MVSYGSEIGMLHVDSFDEKLLDSLWNDADWSKLKSKLFDMQRDIALAAKANDFDAVSMYQKRLTQSMEAKMLAVRHIVLSGATPGIDGIQWSKPSEYLQAAISLDGRTYHASPTRLVIIRSKFSPKERRIKIPTYFDRAMQTIYAYALSPVEETIGDSRSFAFRKNRSTQDVHAYIMSALKKSSNFIVKTDVKSCYESINHNWLLANIPMDTHVLNEFLKAGHFSAGEFFPAEDHGISLGVSLSPILGNMVLNGLQKSIFEGLHGIRYNEEYCDGYLVRFADDILVTADSTERANRILRVIEDFLQQRGMHISLEKTVIVNVHQGIDFLARHYTKNGNTVISCPSDAAVMKMECSLRELILSFKGSQKKLIDKINKKLYGWSSYHKVSNARKAFRHIDVTVKALLLQLCKNLHPNWKTSKIIDQYFFLDHNGKYVYALKNKKDVRVISLSDIALIKHIPSRYTNPYFQPTDIKEIEEQRKIQNVVGKYKAIWCRQSGRCFYCGEQILADQEKSLVHHYRKTSYYVKDIAYIHTKCKQHKIEFVETEDNIDDYEDTIEIIKNLSKNTRKRKRNRKFNALFEYFRLQQTSCFSLNFTDISNIIQVPLCKTAFELKSYWFQNKTGTIGETWISNGYKIKHLDLLKQKITFTKLENKSLIKIPDTICKNLIPKNAKAELEAFFEYLIKKYGL